MEKKPAHLPAFLIVCMTMKISNVAGLSYYAGKDTGSIVLKNMKNMINLYE